MVPDIHPEDPKNSIPKNQIEFRQRLLKGPFQPVLDIFPRTSFSGVKRSFQKSWYQQFTWLEYSPKDDLAFCFPCRMFSGSTGLNIGQSELPIDEVIDDQRKNINSVKELTRQKNREIMRRLIDITVCLGIGGKPFRGHTESKNDVHKGLFLDILIYNFIEGSCVRHAVLEKIANSVNIKLKTLKSVSTTRWACRYEAVSAVKVNYSALLIAINEISESTRQADIRAKCLGIIYQMKTFEFVFALEMLEPILCSILKVSSYLQKSDINLLTAVQLVESLKKTLKTMRNIESNFNNIYKKVFKLCEENQIVIPPVKKRKVSSKVDCFSNTQHFMDTKEEEMKITVYNATLDQMINGINLRFSQETLNMIKSISNVLELNVDDNDITILTDAFGLEAEMLKSEISLLKHTDNVPKNNIKNCDTWIKWLTEFGSGRETIFNNILKMLKIFVTIPVTSCSCERAFSKLSLIKTKLRSTMHQDRLDGLLTMSIEQELAYNINIDEVIEQFKILIPSERRMVL
ncbi:zinc finger MYM-type protein 1-like [Aphis gossypii]|uniref:zinc finger MYM-type protein 1-like n=1 Tax=Aphis gossypii TaxID=80765 RepID=UPI002158BB45|nr:zinc finger MYM-type protein 1-like [Aphis gossypii]